MPFSIPSSFRVLLQCQKFSHHLTQSMAACLEDARGVSPRMVRLLEDEWTNTQHLIGFDHAGKHFIPSLPSTILTPIQQTP